MNHPLSHHMVAKCGAWNLNPDLGAPKLAWLARSKPQAPDLGTQCDSDALSPPANVQGSWTRGRLMFPGP